MTPSTHQLFSIQPWIRHTSSLNAGQISRILKHLKQLLEERSESIRQTHYFHGRYENLYLDRHSHPDLNALLTEATQTAGELLKLSPQELAVGFWFNLMHPGQVTTLHRHDDDDELLSGVVYLSAPQDSGNLMIQHRGKEYEIAPVVGDYVFFDPTTPHAVAENRSHQDRVSIGMNFGPMRRADPIR